MASSSKILTVSYGTFSCTAEGFEDPLGVVKDTTHFFRGVIREDRFFGAEPPQFDPELAAEILQAQLGAEAGQGQLTLRNPYGGAASAGALSAALAAGPVVVRTPAAETPLDRESAEDASGEPAAEAPVAEAPLEEAAEPAPAPAVEPVAEIERAEAEVSGFGEEDIAAAAAETVAQALAEVLPDNDSLEAEAAFFETDDESEALAAPASAPVTPTDPESVAAKLRRIRAVVSGASAPAAPAVAATEPEAEEDTEFDTHAVSAMLSALTPDSEEEAGTPRENLFADALEGDDADEILVAPVLEETLVEEPEVEEVAEEPVEETVAEVLPEEPVAQAEAAPAPEAAPKPRVRARVVKVKRVAFDAAVAAGQLEEVSGKEPEAPESSLSPEDEDELARELAAVRAELEADLGGWDAEEETAELAVSAPAVLEEEKPVEAPRVPVAAWDEEDEEDEFEELAEEDDTPQSAAPRFEEALDDAFADEDDQDDEDDALDLAIERLAHEGARKAVKMSSPARVMLTESAVGEPDTARILDETNTHLEEPEGNRRRSAIAHLRAAVAATRADRLLGRRKDAEAEAEPYREDLATVVRPRRPQASDAASERPIEAARQAPLKLVAEQRVDTTPAAQPLRPRRVRIADLEDEGIDAVAEEGDFAAYAQSVGAKELSELLEAAAAYMSYVEGREQFSRPQLMTKVRQAEARESSREDRLRSFGQLLREGKIEKTRGGRFTVSERISFKPDERAAG